VQNSFGSDVEARGVPEGAPAEAACREIVHGAGEPVTFA
jgi:hypothetical protein